MQADLTPTQRRTLVRIVDASGAWRHWTYVDVLRLKAGSVGYLVRAGLLERRGRDGCLYAYRPTVEGCEVARGRA